VSALSDTVLLVEDDQTLAAAVRYNLERAGLTCLLAADGVRALELARRERPDVVLLDLMLPGMDGLEVCRRLRAESTVPILMLTARAEETDRVVGLEVGADDYITKPFSMRELVARVRATLRRTQFVAPTPRTEDRVGFGNVSLDLARRIATRDGAALVLKPREFDLLAFLATHPGQVFSRDQLLEQVWGYDYEGGSRTIDVHVRWLRQKIEADPARPVHLLTARSVGYRFEPGAAVTDSV